MKTLIEHIEHARKKPHHIRKRIVFASAAGVSTLIALVWLVGGLYFGEFAIQGSTFADSTGQGSIMTTNDTSDSADSGIAGAAAAVSNTNAPAQIEIINAATSTSGKSATEQTTIPF